MRKGRLRFEVSTDTDVEQLADIRVEAMRPSLEAVGRFDPERARIRFMESFQASDTKIIFLDNMVAGFFVVRKRVDHLYLDHLYIVEAFQGGGIGRRVIDDLKAEARAGLLPIRLMALNGSPSNEFYQSCGFDFVSADSLDTIYEWAPEKHSSDREGPQAAIPHLTPPRSLSE